jgi:hypothetical protein
LLDAATQKKINEQFQGVLSNARLRHHLVQRMCESLTAGPAQWQAVMAKVRELPHTRKHVALHEMLAMVLGSRQRYLQTYYGSVVTLDLSNPIKFDIDSGQDLVVAQPVSLPLCSAGADIFYDLEIFVPCDVSLLDRTKSYGQVTITIRYEKFETKPLVCGKNGLVCCLVSVGLPASALQFAQVTLTCCVPVSPILDSPSTVPTLARYRCTLAMFGDPKERDALMSVCLLLPATSRNQSPWMVSGGCIATFFSDMAPDEEREHEGDDDDDNDNSMN